MNAIDKYLDGSARALGVHSQRLDLIASNIANAATPGFKARDIDFASALGAARDGMGTLAKSNGRHLDASATGAGGAMEAKYRVPNQTSLDGNTVELASEQVAFAENAARYEATIGILNGRIKTLMSAIKGE
ncbi:flagellar basal body rod protein FlgB [Pacificimonas sp. WHA3]|uniref:Flagellar basal body rod protein FlgB n=1 Tax=Pacificimonas pallii TaxID=2827236 RepID=A0ABS6SGJ4_9SPHN|nr:flagellar basal body rod protein FlgB [Pacificimonas pallii]MBV7257011.1 flagellar basal body rod protein FlgB [Pacificimonas pallii]